MAVYEINGYPHDADSVIRALQRELNLPLLGIDDAAVTVVFGRAYMAANPNDALYIRDRTVSCHVDKYDGRELPDFVIAYAKIVLSRQTHST